MSIDLTGKRVVVTGGTRGIGRGIVLAMADAGAQVLTCYRTDGEAVERLTRQLKELGGDHHVIRADVSSAADVVELAEETTARLGGVDVLVNNAGVISHVPYEELLLEEWDRVLQTNLTGTFLTIQKLLPLMGEGASIVNVGSRAAVAGIPQRAHYTASKAAVVGLTRSLCKELGRRGIRVNVVAPGVINTDEGNMSDEQKAEFIKRYSHLTALGRFGTPDEIAGAVLFLASDLSSYITGETLHVDGGV